jgi:hypothetical protein
MDSRLPQIRLNKPDRELEYSSRSGRGKNLIPVKDRNSHGQYIQSCLEQAWEDSESEHVAMHTTRNGVYLEFVSSPGFELMVKSLENLTQGIRLCNVRTLKLDEQVITYATVYVPDAKKKFFFERVEKYLYEDKNGKPKNAKLINSIEDLRKALLIESFWTDEPRLIPNQADKKWCEVWLRDCLEDTDKLFERMLDKHDIDYKPNSIVFPERIVKLVFANRDELELITLNSDFVAEYRLGKDTADFLLALSPADQKEWCDDLLERLSVDKESGVSVCIIDTGVNYGHPLISPVLASEDCQALVSDWKTYDHHSHGTLMAGLVAYGDLQHCLESSEPVSIRHLLESVKFLPPRRDNSVELWGDLTKQAVGLAEIQAPYRKRLLCLATTSADTRDRGKPSSWSGAIDQIAAGEDGNKQLIILAAGNACVDNLSNYPDSQLTDSIHDPAQAWNAVSVGAYTDLTEISDFTYADYSPVALNGQLSPFSTTSLTWDDMWPIKPDVVFEGGNLGVDSSGMQSEMDDFRLVSTWYKPDEKLLEYFSMTSAATAQAANFAAKIQAEYPDYWPETVRALMIHSAEWPQAIKQQFAKNDNKGELKKVLRVCGYGVPTLEKALYCASNSLTLIAENYIQPFVRKDGRNKTNDMHFYNLPWPQEELFRLEEEEVEMRITLSYFIEPGPGEIGWKDRYRYASTAFRFDINSPSEDEEEFVKRINSKAREDEDDKTDTESAANYWKFGSKARDKGSIHSDIWTGTAADLATSNLIAVYPVIGWWRERAHLGKVNNKTRYSLVVSITTKKQDIDIYTPVAQQIAISVAPEIKI